MRYYRVFVEDTDSGYRGRVFIQSPAHTFFEKKVDALQYANWLRKTARKRKVVVF